LPSALLVGFADALTTHGQDLAAEEAAFERTFQEVMQKPELIVQPDPDLIDISRS
jgi:hypothetical protein